MKSGYMSMYYVKFSLPLSCVVIIPSKAWCTCTALYQECFPHPDGLGYAPCENELAPLLSL